MIEVNFYDQVQDEKDIYFDFSFDLCIRFRWLWTQHE